MYVELSNETNTRGNTKGVAKTTEVTFSRSASITDVR